MDLHNKIAQISLQKFSILPKTGKPTEKQWTILSTIVKEDTRTNILEVVALGTGTKCIGKTLMSTNGDVLNDSHAEVICRRSFLKYLYFQMKYLILNCKSDILDFCDKTNQFSIRKDINFHFFTTHVPCGDAAIFSKDIENSTLCVDYQKRPAEEVIDGTKRLKLAHGCVGDIYRTGAKCLLSSAICDLHEDGVSYHVVGPVRTKPGRGDPTLSVSCSDKLAKWCYLGIQGSLLSYFIKPIYLKSFTLANKTPYSKDALERAFGTRFGDAVLCEPFNKHNFLIHQSDYEFEFGKTDCKMPCPSSISWWKGIRKPEISVDGRKQGVTKKMKKTKESRLAICKIELMRNFIETTQLLKNCNIPTAPSYHELKILSTKYQDAWNTVKSNIFKVYITKDPLLLYFKLD